MVLAYASTSTNEQQTYTTMHKGCYNNSTTSQSNILQPAGVCLNVKNWQSKNMAKFATLSQPNAQYCSLDIYITLNIPTRFGPQRIAIWEPNW